LPADTTAQDIAGDARPDLAGCVVQMREATGVRAAAEVLRQAGETIALPTVAVIHDLSLPYGPSDETGTKLADVFGWPKGYTEHWEKRQNTFHASVVLRCRSERLPFHWHADEVATARTARPAGAKVSSKSLRIVRELSDLGLRAALVVPVHLPRGRIASVGWWGDLPVARLADLIDGAGTSLFVLASYFFELLREETATEAKGRSAAALSGREVECLTLAANGLTDREMAHRLGLSTHTVHFHLNNATIKLNARNRTHAVGLAAQMGIIGAVREAPPRPTDA